MEGKKENRKKKNTQTAVFGMGCFWTPQRVFDKINGVISTEVGYMGGEEKKGDYSYEDVSYGKSGHAEVIKIEFDAEKINYEELLRIFWTNHDPTEVNRQGPDVGKQYRTTIFYISKNQKKKAEKSKQKEQVKYKEKIATEIVKVGKFYRAEEYHQKFLEKRNLDSCRI
ncbi:peptide-methionine (S)-S-oxide reductase MsrA [Candidatus Pacearchaeota archaeon]|nr:peptide-methionine (S)-S-oxide reductase MsrA [Candidatus Pacearchaeota archaeon]